MSGTPSPAAPTLFTRRGSRAMGKGSRVRTNNTRRQTGSKPVSDLRNFIGDVISASIAVNLQQNHHLELAVKRAGPGSLETFWAYDLNIPNLRAIRWVIDNQGMDSMAWIAADAITSLCLTTHYERGERLPAWAALASLRHTCGAPTPGLSAEESSEFIAMVIETGAGQCGRPIVSDRMRQELVEVDGGIPSAQAIAADSEFTTGL